MAFRNRKLREWIIDLGQFEIATVDELHGVGADVRALGEGTAHLLSRLDVELLRVELEPVGIVHASCGLDAEQNLMGTGVIRSNIVAVIGSDNRDVKLLLNAKDGFADRLVGFKT